MRTKVLVKTIGFLLLITFALSPWPVQAAAESYSVSRAGQRASSPSPIRETYPIMRPDPETLHQWIHDYESAPRAFIDKKLKAAAPPVGTSQSLLSHLNYSPAQRDQGSCGNCWVWAGTGAMEIALDVQNGIHDRLSIQYLNSCRGVGYACCGGTASDFAQFYSERGHAIPWSNYNSGWEDEDNGCGSAADVICSSISTTPNYPISSITAETINTQGISQATAIANIKNILDQNKAVFFAFWLANDADWQDFFDFWNNQDESALWDPDPYCGHAWVGGEGGGHAVLCVGYNDEVAEPYWIMVNSWGTTAGRSNGIFRMRMDIAYDCTLRDSLGGFPGLLWQTLSLGWGEGACTSGYTMNEQPAQFEDISSTGTNLYLPDDGYAYFPIPFAFSFYCDDFTHIAVNSNGTICFEDTYLEYTNTTIPSDSGYDVTTFLAPFWDDLNPGAGGAVYYQIKGSAPNRRLIVQWKNVPHYSSAGPIGGITFQAILYEGSNEILFQYQDVVFGDASYDYGASATVGLQHDVVTGMQYSFNASLVQNGLAIKFSPSHSAPVCEQINDGGFENGQPPGSAWTEWSNIGDSWIQNIALSDWYIPVYAGTYVYWAGGYWGDTPHSGYLVQNISIPPLAKQLKFMANYYRPSTDDVPYRDYFYVKINGTTAFTKELVQANDTYPNWVEEALDISSYAGQTITLRFEGISSGSYTGNVAIDTIRICIPGSNAPVVMPAVQLLLLNSN